MPTVYLSPSTQEYNEYVGGNSEEYYMNLVADDMIPYLKASGINYKRNTPQMTAASSIRQSNADNIDLHLAIHSNASGDAAPGSVRGTQIYYYPMSTKGKKAAQIFAYNFQKIYPISNAVSVIPTTVLGEVAKTRAPAILIEVAYHDNAQDADWIRNNIQSIAKNLVLSICDYFGLPFQEPSVVRDGYVVTNGSALNIRSGPSLSYPVIKKAPNGAFVKIYSDYYGWYAVEYNNTIGYASSVYIRD